MNRRAMLLTLATTALFVLSACSGTTSASFKIDHVHGLGFTSDGSQLKLAAHDGLKLYADGQWQVPNLPKNDYMGFSPTDNGFYTSGHPGPGVKLPEPLGLAKSTDGGKTLTMLGLQGQYDFHVMGVGYNSHAVYVYNQMPSAQLPVGLQFTLDDGKSWKKAGAKGISGQPIQIAVHPTDVKIVAIGSEHGLFLSTNGGDSFEKIWARSPISAVTFSPGGDKLLFGLQELSSYEIASKQIQSLPAPSVSEQDAIGFIAVNPAAKGALAIATFGNEVYYSADSGQAWKQIIKQGKSVASK